MATPKTAPEPTGPSGAATTPTPTAGPPPAAMGTSARGASADLILPRNRPMWTYCASMTELYCLRGRIVPHLAKAWHVAGMNGNGKHTEEGAHGFVTALGLKGMVSIPHNIQTTAWGVTSTAQHCYSPGGLSNYIARYENRRGIVYHSEVWTKFRVLGTETIPETDEEGRLDFLTRCLSYVSPGSLDKAQIELATRGLFRAITSARQRSDERGKMALGKLLVHVPLEFAPRDIRDLAEANQTAA